MLPRPTRFQVLEELSKVSRKMRTLFDARVHERGLTLARARTLLKIAGSHACNQKELADELEIENATLVRLIDGLQMQGLIERREVEGDRRVKQVVLTDEGHALADVVDGMAVQLGRDVLAGISTEELTATLRVLQRMAANIEKSTLAETV